MSVLNSQEGFFSNTLEDLHPEFYVRIGDKSSEPNGQLENITAFFAPSNDFSGITEIEVIKAEKSTVEKSPTEASITFTFSLNSDKAQSPPLFLFQPTANPAKQRMVITARYKNLEDNRLKIIKLSPKETKNDDGSVKLTGMEITDSSSIYLPKDSVVVFSGILRRPTISGSQNGAITMTASAVSTFNGIGASNYRILTNAQADMQRNTASQQPARSAITVNPITTDNKETKLDVIMDNLFGGNSITKDESGKTVVVTTNLKAITKLLHDYSIFIDYSSLKGVVREKPIPSISRPVLTNKNTIMGFIDKVASDLAINYRITPDVSGWEMITFYDYGRGLPFPGAEIPVSPKEKLCVYLQYGQAVTSFSYSCSPLATSTGNLSVKEEKGKLILGELTDDGIYLEYVIDDRKIKEYAATRGVSGITNAIEWAKQNLDGFIAYFTTISKNESTSVPRPPDIGANGISLTLELKYAIPELYPGTLIYFGFAQQTSQVPTYLSTFYRVVKVTDKFSPKDNIWSQSLECAR